MAEEITRYYKRHAGGLVKQKGYYMAYLDKNGQWIEEGKFINMFVGGDCNYDEITEEEAQKLIKEKLKSGNN